MNKLICIVFCFLLVGCVEMVKYKVMYIKETGERVKYWPVPQNEDKDLKIVKIEYFNGDSVRDKWIKQDELITEEEYKKTQPIILEKD